MAATPKEQKASRREQIERAATAHGIEPEYNLPDLDGAEYLVEALAELGEGRASGDRLTSIGWADIAAWMSSTGSRMTAGETAGLRRLSVAYVNQYYESIDPTCVSPCIVELPKPETVVSKMKSLFSLLRK